jgi:hypothetical protein
MYIVCMIFMICSTHCLIKLYFHQRKKFILDSSTSILDSAIKKGSKKDESNIIFIREKTYLIFILSGFQETSRNGDTHIFELVVMDMTLLNGC